jgi:O-antigen ligase
VNSGRPFEHSHAPLSVDHRNVYSRRPPPQPGAEVFLRVAEAVWLLLLIALPAAFNPSGQLAFEPLKTSILRAGAVLIAAAWLAHRLLGRPRTDVGAHPVVRAGVLLVAVAAFSTVVSIEPELSFFGSFDRGMGWLSLAAGLVLLVTGADLFADARARERAITALLLGSIVPCAYWLVQRSGFDPIHWTTPDSLGSSLGSPTFLGGYLVFVVPFALYRVVSTAGRTPFLASVAWLAVLVLACVVVLLADIRGPLVGLVAGLVTFAGLARVSSGKRLARMDILGALGVLGAAATLALIAATTGGLDIVRRFSRIGGSIDSSTERLTVWKDALSAPFTQPPRLLVGFGAETQSVVFEHAEATVRQTPAEFWDRAHNLFLDTWLTGGLLGVAALVLLLGCAFTSAWHAHASKNAGFLPIAVLAALTGHLVEVTFAFHTVVTSAMFWVVLGLAASLTPRISHALEVEVGSVRRRRAIVASAFLAAAALVPLLATPAVADALYGSARRSSSSSGARLEEQAAAWAPWVEELPRAAALDWIANRRTDTDASGRAELDLRLAAEREPLAPLPRVRLTEWFLANGDLEAAENACQDAIRRGPYRARVWDACADVSVRRGQPDEAAARRDRAADPWAS